MEFYVSWYKGDPIYSRYDDDCSVLISITSVPKDWKIDDFKQFPKRLMLDSGGYSYSLRQKECPLPKEVLDQQLKILNKNNIETTLCSLDIPIFDDDLSSNDKDYCIDQTIGLAYEYKNLWEKYHLSNNIRSMAIVQGYDTQSLRYCAYELKSIGFDSYGIGSLAHLYDEEIILSRVKSVIEVVGSNVHVFGKSNINLSKKFTDLGIRSTDSSRPAKSAIYNQVFYSDPFGSFKIPGKKDKNGYDIKKTEYEICNCPVCKGKLHPSILKSGKRSYRLLRSVHNYWHLKRAITN